MVVASKLLKTNNKLFINNILIAFDLYWTIFQKNSNKNLKLKERFLEPFNT